MVARLQFRLSHLICEEDCGPLLVSWAIALSAAVAWLLVVYLTPPAPIARTTAELFPVIDGGVVTVDPGAGYKAPPSVVTKGAGRAVVRHNPSSSALDLAGVFAATAVMRGVAEATSVIAGAQMVRGDVGRPIGSGDKSALDATNGTPTPGMASLGARGGVGTAGAGAGLGQVQRAGGVERSAFHANPLPVVTAPALDGATADATELASFVRARVAQLQSCYELARGTDLAGVVALKITLGDAGVVRSAEIVRRTWSGSGAAETESCLLRIVKGWKLPSGNGGATITLPISFTRGS